MKTLNKKFSLLLAAIMLVSSLSVFANNDPKTDSAAISYEENVMSEAEMDEILFSLDDDESLWLNDTLTYNIYDGDDNLIMSAEIKRSATLEDEKLIKLIAQSDLMMNYNNTLYYRLNNN